MRLELKDRTVYVNGDPRVLNADVVVNVKSFYWYAEDMVIEYEDGRKEVIPVLPPEQYRSLVDEHRKAKERDESATEARIASRRAQSANVS